MLVDILAEYRYSFGLQNSKKMARVPPCVSYMLVTQKSGRVQILVLTATLKKKMARVPPCVSYICLAKKSGRVHVDAGIPELTGCLLKKNVQCPAVPAPKGTVAVWAAGPLDIWYTLIPAPR